MERGNPADAGQGGHFMPEKTTIDRIAVRDRSGTHHTIERHTRKKTRPQLLGEGEPIVSVHHWLDGRLIDSILDGLGFIDRANGAFYTAAEAALGTRRPG